MEYLTVSDLRRNWSGVLDRVESSGESFTITRHGRVVAKLAPVGGLGADLKRALADYALDPGFAKDVEAARMRPEPDAD